MSKVIKASGSKWICLSFSLPSSYNPVHMHVHTCDQHILSFHYYFLHLSPSLSHTLANNFNFTFAFLIKRGSDEQKHLQRLRNPTKWKTSSCKSIYCSSIAERGHTHTHRTDLQKILQVVLKWTDAKSSWLDKLGNLQVDTCEHSVRGYAFLLLARDHCQSDIGQWPRNMKVISLCQNPNPFWFWIVTKWIQTLQCTELEQSDSVLLIERAAFTRFLPFGQRRCITTAGQTPPHRQVMERRRNTTCWVGL